MLQNTNQISHIVDDQCNKCITNDLCIFDNRKRFIEKCLPFNNFDETKKNILNFDKTSYIYYNESNKLTYYLDKNFMLHKYKTKLSPLFENNDILTEEILVTVFNIGDIEIPSYYLFCNYTHVFNIFISMYSLFIIDIENKITQLNIELDDLKKEYDEYNLKIDDFKSKTLYYSIRDEIAEKYQELNALTKNNKKLKKQNTLEKETTLENENILKNETILKKQIKVYNQKLTLILSELKQNKEYAECENNLKINSDQQKQLETNIKKTRNELSLFKKTITNIFQINNENIFIKFSYQFNIFNISLLCEKYFDIVKLLYKDIIEIEDIIEIFKDFSIVNIYYLIKYKKNIKQIYTDKNFMNNNFYSTTLDNTNINDNNKDIYNNIIKIEHQMNNITEINIVKIYKDLHVQLVYIQNILNKVEEYIPNYKKLFLMSIISYRNNNNLINNSWGFLNKKYIKDYIINNTTTFKYTNEEEGYLIDYYKPELPILYEYDSVTYKNVNYGNCMENTIFQFLKVIFWNKETKNYDFNKIKEIINDDNYNFINDLFININNEKTLQFINTWVEFITELPKKYNYIYDNYDFNQKKHQVEINPSLNNLIIALKYLINWTNNDVINDTDINDTVINDTNINDADIKNDTFMNNLIHKINKEYEVNITSETSKTNSIVTIKLIFDEKKYIIILNYSDHASFEGILEGNILLRYLIPSDINSVYSLRQYYDRSSLSFSNLNEYILYLYLFDKNDLFYTYITKINIDDKDDLLEEYIKILSLNDNLLYNLIYKYKNILNEDHISDICNNIIINILDDNSKINKLDKDIIVEFTKYNIIEILKCNNFNIQYTILIKLKEYEIYKKFDAEVWIRLIEDINLFSIFIDILDYSIISNWDISVWISIFNLYCYPPAESPPNIKFEMKKIIKNNFNLQCENECKIKDEIKLIIDNLTEADWSLIFKNTYSIFIYQYIAETIKNNELYNTWINDDTWNNFLIMNDTICTRYYFDYNFINDQVNMTSYLELIFKNKNIMWDELDNFLLKIFENDNSVIDKYYDYIIENKIYDYFLPEIYDVLLDKNHKLIYDLIINDECSEWTDEIWEILITNSYFKNLIPTIKTYERYKHWSTNIWLSIIDLDHIFILFINIIFANDIFKEHYDYIYSIIKDYDYILLLHILDYNITIPNEIWLSNTLWNNVEDYDDVEYILLSYLAENNLCNNFPNNLCIEIINSSKQKYIDLIKMYKLYNYWDENIWLTVDDSVLYSLKDNIINENLFGNFSTNFKKIIRRNFIFKDIINFLL